MLLDRSYHPGWRKLGEIQERRKAMGLKHTDRIPIERLRQLQAAANNSNPHTEAASQAHSHQPLSTAQIDETWRRARSGHVEDLTGQHMSVSTPPSHNAQKPFTPENQPMPTPAPVPTAEFSRTTTMQTPEPDQPEQPYEAQYLPLVGFAQDPRTGANVVLVSISDSDIDAINVVNPNLPRFQLATETHETVYEEVYDDDLDREEVKGILSEDQDNHDSPGEVSMADDHEADMNEVIPSTSSGPMPDVAVYPHQPTLRPQWIPTEGYRYPVPNHEMTNAGAGWQLSGEPLANGPILETPRLYRSRSAQW